jgi:hypothetical protein
LKPIGTTFTNKQTPGKVSEISIEPSSGDDIANAVMEVKTGKCGWMPKSRKLMVWCQQLLLHYIGH